MKQTVLPLSEPIPWDLLYAMEKCPLCRSKGDKVILCKECSEKIGKAIKNRGSIV